MSDGQRAGLETPLPMPTWTLGGMIYKLMRDAGWRTQEEFSEASAVPVATLGKIIRGDTRKPDTDTLDKIASALRLRSGAALLVQLEAWNQVQQNVIPMPTQPDPVTTGDRRKREFSDRARDFARRYDKLPRPMRLALDSTLSAFEEVSGTSDED